MLLGLGTYGEEKCALVVMREGSFSISIGLRHGWNVMCFLFRAREKSVRSIKLIEGREGKLLSRNEDGV